MQGVSLHGDTIARFIARAVEGVPIAKLASEFQLMPFQAKHALSVYQEDIQERRKEQHLPKRMCMTCRNDYQPEHKTNRICKKCKSGTNYKYGQLVAV